MRDTSNMNSTQTEDSDPRHHTVALDCDHVCNNVVAVLDFYFPEYMEYMRCPCDDKLATMLTPVNHHVREMTRIYPNYYNKYYRRLIFDSSILIAKLGTLMYDNVVADIDKNYLSSVIAYQDDALSDKPRVIVFRMHSRGAPREESEDAQ